ncbi:MAG: hypothetical protein RLZZ436_2965 [Planctomycetota bacterium]|jgi:ABC-2 type transport system permease protein
MRGLLNRIRMEMQWPCFWFSLGLFVAMGLLTALLPKVLGNIHEMFERLPLIKPLITALLGVDPGDNLSAQLSQAFLWTHPTVLTLIWAWELMYCSRLPAGEIDRGTADFLMCLPASRTTLFVTESLGWLSSGLLILTAGYSGHLLATSFVHPEMRLTLRSTLMVLSNLAALYLAVGGLAFLLSALSDRRGRAIGSVFAILLASFLVNFLAQFQTWAKQVSWLSMMEYYRPAIVIQNDAFPLADIAVLLAIAAATWTAALAVICRRSICTV